MAFCDPQTLRVTQVQQAMTLVISYKTQHVFGAPVIPDGISCPILALTGDDL